MREQGLREQGLREKRKTALELREATRSEKG